MPRQWSAGERRDFKLALGAAGLGVLLLLSGGYLMSVERYLAAGLAAALALGVSLLALPVCFRRL